MAGRNGSSTWWSGKFSGKPSKLIEEEILKGVSKSIPQEEYAKAAFYLIKEVGLSHNEIFGGKNVVRTENGLKEVFTSQMNVKTFHAYIDLLEQHNEEQKKQRKKQKMKQNMNSKGLGGA